LAAVVGASVFVGLAVSCLPQSGDSTVTGPLPPGGYHVLFIGNSLTYTNDLPGMLSVVAASGGDTIRTASVAYPNYALVDHFISGVATDAIKKDRWDYVIMQQGPTSTTGVARDTLILATRAFNPYIRAAGGRAALLMVWPDYTRKAFWDNCRTSYFLAAQAVGGVFMPAGEAWRNAWAVDSTLPLYGGDGFHPASYGTYLAALVIYERITGHDARTLPPRATFGNFAAPEATIRLLQNAAHKANIDYPSPTSAR
jgi:hypothetical protein